MEDQRQDVKIALLRIHARPREKVVHEFARLLKIITGFGYTHSSRQLINGGTEVKICEPKQGFAIAEVINLGGKVYVCFPTVEWFDNSDYEFPDRNSETRHYPC